MTDDLVPYSPEEAFMRDVLEACVLLSPSRDTRRAYFTDAERWAAFCRQRRVDPYRAPAVAVAAWVESMRASGSAPTTRSRRLSALSSIYGQMRRDGKVADNPFSPETGPRRERAQPERPTPMVELETVRRALRACEAGGRLEDLRDAAIIRVLWQCGARRSSVAEITRERLRRDGAGYACTVPAKGRGGRGKTVRLWFGGRTARAVERLVERLEQIGIESGSIWRTATGAPMTGSEIWRAVHRRGEQAGGRLSPHSFRVAFLTLNPSGLEAKQDAAGHADPATTRLYDRSWRGREAFESMPDVEDVE